MTHAERMELAIARLDESTNSLLQLFAGVPRPTTMFPLPGGWSPAQHVCHVGLTNEVFAGVLKGTGPLPSFRGTSDFSEAAWNLDAPPIGVSAPPILVPPGDVTPEQASARLRASVETLRPAIRALDAARAQSECVRLPWAVVSLCQMSEWAAGHTLRHIAQVRREAAAIV